MHTLVILIISSPGEIYLQFKQLQTQYLRLFANDVKYYFVECRPELENEIVVQNDHIFVKGDDSFTPGIIKKTCAAIQWVNQNIPYKILLRMNLSTLLHMRNVLDFVNSLPKFNVYAGFYLWGFATGSAFFLDKYTSQLVADHCYLFDMENEPDDVLVARCIQWLNQNGCSIRYFNPVPKYKWEHIVNDRQVYRAEGFLYSITNNTFRKIDVREDVLHYRIKNRENRSIDIEYFRYLMKEIYGV